MTKRFDKYEQRGAYHWQWYEDNFLEYRTSVNTILNEMPFSGTVIDIGGGDGLITYKIFERGLAAKCIDTNARGIRLAQKKIEQKLYAKGFRGLYNRIQAARGHYLDDLVRRYHEREIEFEIVSVYDLSLDQKFDYAICHEVIEHVPDPERLLDIIHELIRHYAIISAPNDKDDPYGFHRWTPDEFESLLKNYKYEFLSLSENQMYVKLYR